MKYRNTFFILLTLFTFAKVVYGQWPMSNDMGFNADVAEPTYEKGKGPKILLDGAHHNFLIQIDLIKPFSDLAKADGYVPVVDSLQFTPEYLERFDIVMIITALPFDFATKNEVTDETTFTQGEIDHLYEWVIKGGSLLVFSEHAPFDQAINPLLNKFGISSSIGYTIDTLNYDKEIGRTGWIEYSRENGLLNIDHPIMRGRKPSEQIDRLLTFGGSGLSGEGFSNLMQLSESAQNTMHATGVGPIGLGNSQGLVGKIGEGKLVAFSDSNGFVAMVFNNEDKSEADAEEEALSENLGLQTLKSQAAGMNLQGYDWKQFVLNTLHWLSE